ncbi:hypothetical protein ACOSQ3_020969 [Xanthoceras sorbifolium]
MVAVLVMSVGAQAKVPGHNFEECYKSCMSDCHFKPEECQRICTRQCTIKGLDSLDHMIYYCKIGCSLDRCKKFGHDAEKFGSCMNGCTSKYCKMQGS